MMNPAATVRRKREPVNKTMEPKRKLQDELGFDIDAVVVMESSNNSEATDCDDMILSTCDVEDKLNVQQNSKIMSASFQGKDETWKESINEGGCYIRDGVILSSNKTFYLVADCFFRKKKLKIMCRYYL